MLPFHSFTRLTEPPFKHRYPHTHFNMRFSTPFAATALWVLQIRAQSWDVPGVAIVCDKNASSVKYGADVTSSRVNAVYLENIKTGEKPQNGAGLCGQVACNYGTTIIWCNNNPTPMTLDNFTVIADAWNLMNSKLTGNTTEDCVQLGPPGLKAAGEIFHPNGFSVRIGGNAKC